MNSYWEIGRRKVAVHEIHSLVRCTNIGRGIEGEGAVVGFLSPFGWTQVEYWLESSFPHMPLLLNLIRDTVFPTWARSVWHADSNPTRCVLQRAGFWKDWSWTLWRDCSDVRFHPSCPCVSFSYKVMCTPGTLTLSPLYPPHTHTPHCHLSRGSGMCQGHWGAYWVCCCVAHCICSYKLIPFKASFSCFQEFPKVLSHVSCLDSLAATLLPWCRQRPWALLFCWGFWSPRPPPPSLAIVSLSCFELSVARGSSPEHNWDQGAT